jgi:hypothetical protein
MNRPMPIEELINHLMGSSDSACVELDHYTAEECELFYTSVFNCTGCGWWCDFDERNIVNDEEVCDQCVEENE